MNKENRSEFASKLIDLLPHGSGIDCDWEYDVPKTSNTVRLSNSYHCMNDGGYYDGYADFTLIVDVACFDFTLQFNGSYSQRLNYKYFLRDYLEETFACTLDEARVDSD